MKKNFFTSEKIFTIQRFEDMKIFLHIRCFSYTFYTRKNQQNLKKQSVHLFFQMLKFFSCCSKIFQNGSLGTKNGPSDPLKFLVSLEISKLGPLAHF